MKQELGTLVSRWDQREERNSPLSPGNAAFSAPGQFSLGSWQSTSVEARTDDPWVVGEAFAVSPGICPRR